MGRPTYLLPQMTKCRIPGLRIGCTSFIIPDHYVPAVRGCIPYADDIALLLLEAGHNGDSLISKREIDELIRIADGENITWNIHLPADGDFSSMASTKRLTDNILRAIDLTLPLHPHTWVTHVVDNTLLELNTPNHFSEKQTEMIIKALARISAPLPNPAHLALENLELFAMDLLDEILTYTPYSRCFDIGHVWKDHLQPEKLLTPWLSKIRMCHLHGTSTRDHQSLCHIPSQALDAIMHPLWDFAIKGISTLEVITLEVFTLDNFLTSHQALLESHARYQSSKRP